MKTKRFSLSFWSTIFFLIPVIVVSTGFLFYLIYKTKDNLYILFLFLPLGLVGYIWKKRIDIFSVVEITEDNLTATLFGKVWFDEKWEEIPHIGEFETGRRFAHYQFMYFSLFPIDDFKTILRKGAPSSAQLECDTVFLLLTPKIYDEILRYVDKGKIIHHGWVGPF